MLLYVTLDDVIGGPEDGGPAPLPTPSSVTTLAELYDKGMRHHARAAAMLHWESDRLEPTPDWRLDRQVIRVALYCREHLQLEPGDRVAVFGPLGWLWPIAEFAAMGQGAVAVGLEHDLGDDALARALAEAAPRIAFATDTASAARLLRVREDAALPETLVVPAGVSGEARGCVPLGQLLDLGATLDTAERARSFRTSSRSLSPESAACWHFRSDGAFTRLTHAQAMALVAAQASGSPARREDVAYIEGPRVSLATRLACYGFVGDGYTTTALGREGRASEDVPALRPHRLLASGPWLERTWAEVEESSDGVVRRLARLLPRSRWLRSLDRRGSRVRRALRARLGDRLRSIETPGPLAAEVAAALSDAGLSLTNGHR